MLHYSRPILNINKISLIAIVVSDLDEVIGNYRSKFIMGPWEIFSIKLSKYSYKYAICKFKNCNLKLIQPTKGKSIFSKHLELYGEGLHHLEYSVESLEKAKTTVNVLKNHGISLIAEEQFVDEYYAYMDTTKFLGCIFAINKQSDLIPLSPYKISHASKEERPLAIKVDEITQVALIVEDLLGTVKNYWNIFGIGPWSLIECKPPLIHDLTYKGKSAEFTSKVAVAKLGGLEIEPITPVSGKNIYKDFLIKYGEGLHHLQFVVNDIKKTKKIMEELGFSVLMSLGFSDGEAVYFNTFDDLKTIWEAFQPPKSFPDFEKFPNS